MSATREERLAEENRRLRQELEALRIQLQELETIRRNLEHTVAVYKRCLFGSRSEKIDPQELEVRIAKAAAEAREQLAKEKRLKQRLRRTSPRTRRRNAKLARTAGAVFQRICRVDESSTPSIPHRPSVRVAPIIRP